MDSKNSNARHCLPVLQYISGWQAVAANNGVDGISARLVSIERRGIRLVEASVAHGWWQRLRGLFAYPQLKSGRALLISPCSSVHSFFLGYTIDVVFLSQQHRVLKCVGLKRNRLSACPGAHCVLELASGEIKQLGLCVGDQLVVGVRSAP